MNHEPIEPDPELNRMFAAGLLVSGIWVVGFATSVVLALGSAFGFLAGVVFALAGLLVGVETLQYLSD